MTENDLIEPQGVNAGPPIDRDPAPDRRSGPAPTAGGDAGATEETGETGATGEAGEGITRTPGPDGPPEEPEVTGTLSDEMVGLPGHLPGYPGQERSIDTG